ncbi:hypothetical protein [Streptomyces sp. NBC_01353]|nr:hypothetical protein [Streptomyces sp. NBC_01353]
MAVRAVRGAVQPAGDEAGVGYERVVEPECASAHGSLRAVAASCEDVAR